MKYKIRGELDGRKLIIIWEDGELAGDGEFSKALSIEAGLNEGMLIGPIGGPYTDTKHIEDGLSTYVLIHNLLDQVFSVTGDIPVIPTVPRGAIP